MVRSDENTKLRRHILFSVHELSGRLAVTRNGPARKAVRSALDVSSHWRNSADSWAAFGSPLRPCAEDVRIVDEMLAAEPDLFGGSVRRRVWLLGVTPEIATACRLQDVELLAVERVRDMIDSAWPGDTGSRHAICADWLRPPFADGSFDLAIGDGCLMVAGYPDELSRLLVSVNRCLRPDGCLMLRLFCRPDVAETPDAVIGALRSGEIGSFHAFKWRLAMAVQGMANAPDVAVDEVWQIWNAARIDAHALAEARGWPLAQVGTMEFYRGSPARYNFMRFDATIEHLCRAGFDLVTTRIGTYELAECCPHVLLRKRRSSSETGMR